ncbi:MAG: rhodanese-like domain-containing protein [Thermoplasmata archaeon]
MSREELKERLDRGEPIKLVMTMNEWQFKAEHIPGSLWVADKERAEDLLDPEDLIVTYCSDRACSASRMAAFLLEKAGYKHVWHYEGGLQDWTSAGYPVEGDSSTRLRDGPEKRSAGCGRARITSPRDPHSQG